MLQCFGGLWGGGVFSFIVNAMQTTVGLLVSCRHESRIKVPNCLALSTDSRHHAMFLGVFIKTFLFNDCVNAQSNGFQEIIIVFQF